MYGHRSILPVTEGIFSGHSVQLLDDEFDTEETQALESSHHEPVWPEEGDLSLLDLPGE